MKPGIIAANRRRQVPGSDPYWSDVVGLWGWEAANPNHLLDESSFGNNLSSNGSFGRSTDFAAFGGASAGRTGAGGASRATRSHDSDFVFSGAFTIELWHRFRDAGNAMGTTVGLAAKWLETGNQRGWALTGFTGGVLRGMLSADGSTAGLTLTGTTAYTPQVWHHICLERDGSGLVRLYLDGVVEASGTFGSALFNNTGADLEIGGYNGGNGNPAGYRLDEVRITKDVARYNGAFTPPAAAFPRF